MISHGIYDLNVLVIIWKQVFKPVNLASAINTTILLKKSYAEHIIYL